MKQLLEQYSAYNLWANKNIIEQVNQLSEEQKNKEIITSFPSIYKTMMHLMEVENVWLERIKLVDRTTPPGWFNGSFQDLSTMLLQLSQQWFDWVRNAHEANITEIFAYKTTKGEHFKQPVYEVLLHLFNHQTFHRGQLVTMLRQLGVDKIAPADFIVFSRKPTF